MSLYDDAWHLEPAEHLIGQTCPRCGHPHEGHHGYCACGCNYDPKCEVCGHLTTKHARRIECPCGCPPEMHIGEIGCGCGMPDEPPCLPAATQDAE